MRVFLVPQTLQGTHAWHTAHGALSGPVVACCRGYNHQCKQPWGGGPRTGAQALLGHSGGQREVHRARKEHSEDVGQLGAQSWQWIRGSEDKKRKRPAWLLLGPWGVQACLEALALSREGPLLLV